MCGGVPGTVLGSVDVLKESTPGSDFPCWFSAITWTSYSVSQSRPLSTTYSLLCGMRISGFQSLPCFCGGGVEMGVGVKGSSQLFANCLCCVYFHLAQHLQSILERHVLLFTVAAVGLL